MTALGYIDKMFYYVSSGRAGGFTVAGPSKACASSYGFLALKARCSTAQGGGEGRNPGLRMRGISPERAMQPAPPFQG